MSLLIANGRVVDPANGIDQPMDVFIEQHTVTRVAESLDIPDGAEVFDATGCIVAPGLIDMNVQLREPGFEEDETIESGTAAALAGGIATVACLPNTSPAVDSQASVEFIQLQAARSDNCNVVVVACVSKDRAGEQLAEIGSLARAGAVAFSDATKSVFNPELMRRALEYTTMFGKPILNHPEVPELTAGGTMHTGAVSTALGLGGLSAEAEDVMVSRDLRLSEATGGQVHIMNVSTSDAVELIRRAKSRGAVVTSGVTAAHFSATDEMLRSFDSNCKLNPPLRSQDHVDACIEGLQDGTIDVIVSGHAPRSAEKKMCEIDLAPFGMSGLETLIGLVSTHLVHAGHLSWGDAIAKLSWNPAKILQLENKGSLSVGGDADVTIIDPQRTWVVDPLSFVSKSRNTPFGGHPLVGAPLATVVGGRLKWTSDPQRQSTRQSPRP